MCQNTFDGKFLSVIDIGCGIISRLRQHTVHLWIGCPLSNSLLQSQGKALADSEVIVL